jgi:repressor LexA
MDETTNTPHKLTKRQEEVLSFIVANSAFYGPSIREIAAGLGIASPNGVVCHLKALERKGAIKRHSKRARGIQAAAQ